MSTFGNVARNVIFKMKIRELEETDLKDLIPLYKYLHENDTEISREKAHSVWGEVKQNNNLFYFGGFHENLLVSSCCMAVIPNLTRGGLPYALIENVVTHLNYRNKGYGSSVLRYTLAKAWSMGCYKVMLLSGRKDPAVHRFYEQVGFNSNDKTAFVIKCPHV